MGGDVSRQRRVGGQASLGQDPQGIEVATGGVDGGSPRCGALQGDVPGGAVCPPQGSAWFEESGGGSRTLHPRDLLSHTEAEPTLPRAWRRLSPPAAFGGSVHKAASLSVGEARAQGPARGDTPTRIGGLYSSVFSHQTISRRVANRSQAALRSDIKGKPPAPPRRLCVSGQLLHSPDSERDALLL